RVGHAEPRGRRVVIDVTRSGLGREPLADVTLVRAGLLGELVRRRGTDLGKGPIEPEPIADDDKGRVGGAAEVPNDLVDQRLEFRVHGLHDVLRSKGTGGPDDLYRLDPRQTVMRRAAAKHVRRSLDSRFLADAGRSRWTERPECSSGLVLLLRVL